MKLYRAIIDTASHVDGALIQETRASRRIPRNVPYVVDNVWEYLRPGNAPSRRHAAYASPTPELAGSNASSPWGSSYNVWEVELEPQDVIAICPVSDAKHHADVRRVPAALMELLEPTLGAADFETNREYSPLFMPAAAGADLTCFFKTHTELAAKARAASSFWQEAKVLTFEQLLQAPQLAESAEIFFDARKGFRVRATPA